MNDKRKKLEEIAKTPSHFGQDKDIKLDSGEEIDIIIHVDRLERYLEEQLWIIAPRLGMKRSFRL